MSIEALPADHVCYVNCNFCNTILAVSVPGNTMFNIVTVRCGHCANLLSVNLGGTHHQSTGIPYSQSKSLQNYNMRALDEYGIMECGTSSSRKCNKMASDDNVNKHFLPLIRPPPEKRQRVPSAYNRFIKDEIQRIKTNNPDISHREAFSAASKNWAHFPRIHLNLNLEAADRQTRLGDEVVAGKRRDPKLRRN